MAECQEWVFQSTLPARGATYAVPVGLYSADISIHAPRTGSDSPTCAHSSTAVHFNPRSPHGERPIVTIDKVIDIFISIHAPRTGSDHRSSAFGSLLGISIHAPRTGSDQSGWCRSFQIILFQSTLPARGATDTCSYCRWSSERFQSTLPARGATRDSSYLRMVACYFNPRSPHGERRTRGQPQRCGNHFNPRSPHGERQVNIDELFAASGISIHAPRTGSDNYQGNIRSN